MSATAHLRTRPRRLRTFAELRALLNALPAQHKAALWADLTAGTPPRWATDRGPNADALAVLQLLGASLTLSPADSAEAKLRAAVLYLFDNPRWLVELDLAPEARIEPTETL